MEDTTDSWLDLNARLKDANEKSCEELLQIEKTYKKRPHFLLRIYGRFNKLRSERERRELLGAEHVATTKPRKKKK